MGRGKILFTEQEVDLMTSENSSNSKILGETLIFSFHLNSVLSLCLLNSIFFNLKQTIAGTVWQIWSNSF